MTRNLEERRRDAPNMARVDGRKDNLRIEPSIEDRVGRLSLLEHWRGCYDRVLFALHPFEAHDGSRTASYAEAARACDAPNFATMFWTTFVLARAYATPVDPRPQGVGFPDLIDRELMERIGAWMEDERLDYPANAVLPPILAPAFADAFEAVGATRLVARPEFEADTRRLNVDRLRVRDWSLFEKDQFEADDDEIWVFEADWLVNGRIPKVIHDEECRLLIASQVADGLDTIITLREDVAEAAALEDRFEGLWASPTTTEFWFDDLETLRPPPGFDPR